jgi:hypothetical protein
VTWVNYTRHEDGDGGEITTITGEKKNKQSSSSGISHNFVLGVDFRGEEIWVATSSGLSHGTLIK